MPRAGISSLPATFCGRMQELNSNNSHSLLMFTSVLSGTLVTGSCSEEPLRSKDSFTYWHPWSR